jgi:hypothetical protein
MQTANIMLKLNAGNDVPKRGVSAAEIAVLIAIHGDESVQDIEPTGSSETVDIDGARVKWTNRVELDRLRRRYGKAKDDENNFILDRLFPGAAALVFETLDELNIPDAFYKATARFKPDDAPELVEDEDEGEEIEAFVEPAITPPPSEPETVKADPLDHDGNGKKGGAKKPAKAVETEESLFT